MHQQFFWFPKNKIILSRKGGEWEEVEPLYDYQKFKEEYDHELVGDVVLLFKLKEATIIR